MNGLFVIFILMEYFRIVLSGLDVKCFEVCWKEVMMVIEIKSLMFMWGFIIIDKLKILKCVYVYVD